MKVENPRHTDRPMTDRPHSTEPGEDRPVLEPDDARAAETTGHMRYVLGLSLALAVMAMGALGVYYVTAA